MNEQRLARGITDEGIARLKEHEARLDREERIEKFFTAKQIKTADAILFGVGQEISLEPQEV